MTYTVRLPWPAQALWPNRRVHWARKADAARSARLTAWGRALEIKARKLRSDGCNVRVTFCPPDRRRRDLDNMLAACKPYFDGIADATGIDDSEWSISLERAEPVKGGAVIVEVSA